MEGGTEVKVLMVGPKGSGKSALANYIADAVQNSETPSQAFPETKGVRIVEFDRKVRGKKGTENVSVELWDVSGNRELYEGTWPAIMHGAVGVVYVYDATKVGEEKDLDQWHRSFGQSLGVKDSQILVMAHKKADVKTHKGSLPKSLSHVQTVSTTLEDSQSIIKEHFDRFLVQVAHAARENKIKEEDSMLN